MINFLNLKESINFFFIFATMVFFFFCILLYLNNKKLKQQIKDLKKERKEILERKIMKEEDPDLVSIQNISSEKKECLSPKKTFKPHQKEGKTPQKPKLEYVPTMPKRETHEETKAKKNTVSPVKINQYKTSRYIPPTKNLEKNTQIRKTTTTNPEPSKSLAKDPLTTEKQMNELIPPKNYQKNTFQTNNKITSPVSISNQETFNIDKLSLDLNEFIKRSEKVVPKIEEKKHSDYLKEISKQIETSLEPEPIELTDYEKEQEEHAIISYQELLSLKDNIKIKDDEEETIDFIEELKHFRNNLH